MRKYDSILKALSSLENAYIFLERTLLTNSVLFIICGLGSVWRTVGTSLIEEKENAQRQEQTQVQDMIIDIVDENPRLSTRRIAALLDVNHMKSPVRGGHGLGLSSQAGHSSVLIVLPGIERCALKPTTLQISCELTLNSPTTYDRDHKDHYCDKNYENDNDKDKDNDEDKDKDDDEDHDMGHEHHENVHERGHDIGTR
ncbi:hypothetical protein ANN_09415 [Periplaneta americana]|uniref:Uncharacterized protein n=1 Tax=Periplaneta americana TaxID=6978 RepID=A0ABQ8TNH2_PERAM|nr:hypothetical protein ANN_09415 [Periplaneta americana]